ncbi:hypothetical protein Tco_1017982 [Tanacetum coccineum]|uniref:Uncharacterized protein n=1 Tax=Tanacetum coccineum TaxID=301880 RepID=A0ABQ5FVM3_9ASTR
MSWFSRCSWCGGPFNGGNCQHCTNVSLGDEFVRNPDPISNDETLDFSYPHPQPQASSLNQFHCFHCKDPLEEGEHCQRCTCKWCGYGLREGSCWICPSRDENSSIDAPNSFNDLPNVFTHPPQPQYETYSCELCENDSHHGYDCPPGFPLATNISTHTLEPSRRFNYFYDDNDYKESTIPLNEIVSQIPLSIAITPVLLTLEPEDSLIMGNEELSTIPKKESDKVIKSSVEDLVPIPCESEDTFGSDSECDLPSCNDFSPINVFEEKSVTFSNPLFDSNNDFTSSDDESLSDEDVPKYNVKIYSNPLFEFDDEYISSDVNPLFDEVLENIESKDSYVSNLNEPPLLVTPLSDANKDECFDPGGEIDEIDAFLDIDVSTDIENGYHDSEGDIIDLECFLINETIPNLPPEVFLDHDPRSLKNGPDKDDLKSLVKIFYLGIHEKTFSPTYVSLPYEDLHYLSLTYVI